MEGQADIVRCLLPRVNSAAEDNIAIRYAGTAEVARLLLADKRVNPAARSNAAILMAHLHGKAEVVRVLLSDPRVNPHGHTTYEDWFRDPRSHK